MQLNINSVFNKNNELDEILNSCKVDIFSLNESKLDYNHPLSWYTNKNYKCVRLDRNNEGGGGELLFLRKGIFIKKI